MRTFYFDLAGGVQRKKLFFPPHPLFSVKTRYSPFERLKARSPMAASSQAPWPATSGPIVRIFTNFPVSRSKTCTSPKRYAKKT